MVFDTLKYHILQNLFLLYIIVLERFLCIYIFGYGIARHTWYLLYMYFLLSQKIVDFFNFKIIVKWFIFTCFLDVIIPLIVLYMINSILVRVFEINFKPYCY
jgi:hypothetical protein